MAAEWRNFKAKMKTKRIDKGKGKKKDNVSAFNEENDTLVVQRLSAEVSGKAQKYSRIGAREFVSYDYEEFTIANIRRACEKHFAVDKSMSCDILAGEQGPSCDTVKQIPDSRVIHVRFVERVGEGTEPGIRERGPSLKSLPAKRNFSDAETKNRSEPKKSAPSLSKFVPRSLSVVEMLKLGKVITQSTTSVHIYAFNFNEMSWSKTPSTVDFSMDKEPFGTGGFRQAFKATSNDKEFQGTWVIKKYLPKSITDIEATGQSNRTTHQESSADALPG